MAYQLSDILKLNPIGFLQDGLTRQKMEKEKFAEAEATTATATTDTTTTPTATTPVPTTTQTTTTQTTPIVLKLTSKQKKQIKNASILILIEFVIRVILCLWGLYLVINCSKVNKWPLEWMACCGCLPCYIVYRAFIEKCSPA